MDYKNVNFKSIEVYEEMHHGVKSYLAKVVVEAETDYGKYEITYPKIDLLVDTEHIPIVDMTCGDHLLSTPEHFIRLFGSSQLPLRRDEAGNVSYMKVIEEYPQKMTLKEIEQKLGYKVELVSEK